MSQARITQLLRESPDFSSVPFEALNQLACTSRLLTLKPGDFIWRVGDLSREVYVPEPGGLVRVGRRHPDGTYITTVLVFQGQLIGEMGVLGRMAERFNEAEALSACQVVQMPADTFRDFVAGVPWAKDYWLHAAHVRHSMAVKQTYALSRRAPHDRLRELVSVLVEYMPQRQGDGLKLPFKQEVLGHMANLSRQATNKVLVEWQQQGVIDIGYQALIITQPGYFRASLPH